MVPDEDLQRRRLARRRRDSLKCRANARAQLARKQRLRTERDHRRSEVVCVAKGIARDEPLALERQQQPVRRGLLQIQLRAQLPQSEVGLTYESDTIEAGDRELIIDSPFGKLGISVCYDLRFPEFFRRLARKGAEIIFVPSAFTAETGAAHWELLLRARAVENLCYVVAPNQGGFHINGRKTFGHSMIVDPWGVILDCYKTGGGFVSADIDRERLAKVRKSFPVLEHRKFFASKQ